MSKLINKILKTFKKSESGATAIEYGLLAALIAVAIVLVVAAVGQNLGFAFKDVNEELKKAPAAQKAVAK